MGCFCPTSVCPFIGWFVSIHRLIVSSDWTALPLARRPIATTDRGPGAEPGTGMGRAGPASGHRPDLPPTTQTEAIGFGVRPRSIPPDRRTDGWSDNLDGFCCSLSGDTLGDKTVGQVVWQCCIMARML